MNFYLFLKKQKVSMKLFLPDEELIKLLKWNDKPLKIVVLTCLLTPHLRRCVLKLIDKQFHGDVLDPLK